LGSVPAQAHGPRGVGLIEGYYQRYLGRVADACGLQVWTRQLHCSGPEAVQAGILASDEYYCRHGHTPEGFVAGLYQDVLGRQACGWEIQTWARRLGPCGNRQNLAAEFLVGAQAELAARAVPPAPVCTPPVVRGPVVASPVAAGFDVASDS